MARNPAAKTREAAARVGSEEGVTDPAEVLPLELFTKLARTSLLLDAFQRECLAEHELAFVEFSVLRLLRAAPRRRLSPTRLAERIVRTTGAMTKLVDRLERSGYVAREPDPSDRRAVLVRLTAAGSRVANEAHRSYTEGRQRVLSRLSKRDVAAASKSLGRLLEVLELEVLRTEPEER